jgi:hypothetical protein
MILGDVDVRVRLSHLTPDKVDSLGDHQKWMRKMAAGSDMRFQASEALSTMMCVVPNALSPKN